MRKLIPERLRPTETEKYFKVCDTSNEVVPNEATNNVVVIFFCIKRIFLTVEKRVIKYLSHLTLSIFVLHVVS